MPDDCAVLRFLLEHIYELETNPDSVPEEADSKAFGQFVWVLPALWWVCVGGLRDLRRCTQLGLVGFTMMKWSFA